MANEQHLNLLKQGVETWNQWREKHANITPDLYRTDLSGANLSGANLSSTNLISTNLSFANLSGANLISTNLSDANLSSTNLSSTNLNSADLSGANLNSANLSGANLSGANLSGARMVYTILGNVDLRSAKGLETVVHYGPSTIGIDTIYRSQATIPGRFLKEAGVQDTFLTFMHSLVHQPFEYNTCFISYSSKDQEFAERLHTDLQTKGVRCWFAPEDMKIGDKIRERIDESIHLYDKLLLVLSQFSIASQWVEQEVETALAKERRENRAVLFPIRLDKTIMECMTGWSTLIQNTRHIGNFERWKHHDDYQKALSRLLRDLKAE